VSDIFNTTPPRYDEVPIQVVWHVYACPKCGGKEIEQHDTHYFTPEGACIYERRRVYEYRCACGCAFVLPEFNGAVHLKEMT
jgi:hypothetical protein